MNIGHDRSLLVRRVARLNSLGQVALLLIAVGYWWVQVAEGDYYRELAENNRLRQLPLEAPRGLIYDRHGRQLVDNIPGYALLFDRGLSENVEESLAFAAEILGKGPAELERRRKESPAGKFQQVRLADRLDLSQVARFSALQLEHPEFEIAVAHQRLNRHAHHTAHLLGYLSRVGPRDLDTDEKYRPDDLKGRKGLEGLYEAHLRGQRGRQVVVVDSRGRLVERLEPRPALSGGDLRLTLDLELQQEAARLLGDQRGAIVALDPRNGDVLALYSAPSFDPNAFARGLDPESWRALSENPQHPLQNRAHQSVLPPGSIFKIVLAIAGLEEGMIHAEQDRVYCSGATRIYNQRRRCWNRGGHGWENLEDALLDSCDVYFYELGKELGIERIAAYARRLGLGRATGIALSGEKGGLVPDEAWSRRVRGEPWYPGETVSVAIGQGPILTSPLQLAVMLGAVARGYLVTPRLVLSEPVRPGERLPFDEEHLEIVRRALLKVVHDPRGTGREARPRGVAIEAAGIEIAGKTGTAQVVRQETWTKNEDLPPQHRDHAWFAGYAPSDDPRFVVVVYVEHGGGGSKVAAPIARALYEKYFTDDLPQRLAATR